VRRDTTDNGRVTETVDSDLADVVLRARNRDIARATAALTRWPHPDPAQRSAIADHVSWMSSSFVQQGVSVPEAVDELSAVARRYRSDASARHQLVAALDTCSVSGWTDGDVAVLAPTNAQRAATACWLEDEADDDARALIRDRFHTRASRPLAFTARRVYRREAYRRWYLPEHSGLNRQLSCRVSVDVAAPVEAVWQVVSDPTRTPEWSHECRRVEFLGGTTEPGPGAVFAGANRHGRTTWSRTCTIFSFDEAREFGYVTSGRQGDATAWHFRLDPIAAGTRLSQAYQIVAMPAWVSMMVGMLMPSHDDRSDALRADLTRLGALAEQLHRHGSPA
jgi:Polyketide cyclase / dehydrase and lipid transport